MEKKMLGKITKVVFGYGGYQDAMFGISFTFESIKESWGVGDFKGDWSIDIKVDKNTKWTEDDRDKRFAEIYRFINKILQDAKKQTINQLVGVPVEVTFENNTLKEWRILTEVI